MNIVRLGSIFLQVQLVAEGPRCHLCAISFLVVVVVVVANVGGTMSSRNQPEEVLGCV